MQREYTITATVTIKAEDNLADPFVRVAVFRDFVNLVHEEGPLTFHTAAGIATATFGLMTASS